jgi:signal transduction histidine kinase
MNKVLVIDDEKGTRETISDILTHYESLKAGQRVNNCQELLTIQGEGQGMDESDIDKIGIYHQFDASKYDRPGLGIGLTIVKILAKAHNLDFIINSESGKSVEVILKIPSTINTQNSVLKKNQC